MNYDCIKNAYQNILPKIPFTPKIGLVLGSGLNNFADTLDIECIIPYAELEGFPVSTISGHKGQFVFGYTKNEHIPLVVMQGRVHYYEGYSTDKVVAPIRLLKLIGVQTLILTNSSGGINERFYEGAFMVITDHIMSVPNPLIGKNIDQFGIRFPDMTTIYDRELCLKIVDAAQQLNQEVFSGTYMQVSGPSFETPAEIRAFRVLGADAVGMSTACEAVAARHSGMRVCGISCISNMASGMNEKAIDHEDINKAAKTFENRFFALVNKTISLI